MNKTYAIRITTQYNTYQSDSNIQFIDAPTAVEAIKKLRKIAKREGWFDSKIDGRVTYKNVKDY